MKPQCVSVTWAGRNYCSFPQPNFFFKILFIYLFIYLFILDREEGREKERERNINVWLPLAYSPLGTWPGRAIQAGALTGNGTGDPLVCRPALSPETHQLGPQFFFMFAVHIAVCQGPPRSDFNHAIPKTQLFCLSPIAPLAKWGRGCF